MSTTRGRAFTLYQAQRHIERGLRQVRQTSAEWGDWYEMLLKKKTKLAKRSPYDCGKTRCRLCHYEKVWYRKARETERRKAIQDQIESAA